MKRAAVLAISILAMAMLAACTGDSLSVGVTDAGDQPFVSATPTSSPEAAPAATEVAAQGAQPSPTLRPGLEATDPASVNLASGRPTLVEFFAFW